MTNPLSKLAPAAQDILTRAFLTLVHSAVAVAVANQAAGVPITAQSSTVIAGLSAAVSILWHGLPALVGAAKAKRLARQLSVLAAIEAQVRASIAAQQQQAQVLASIAAQQPVAVASPPVNGAPLTP